MGGDSLIAKGLLARMVQRAKEAEPAMLVVVDVCFCEYTDHGHCGVINQNTVVNDDTLANLGQQAVIAAQAGALDEERTVLESVLSIKRAGADIILSYFTPDILRYLQG